MITFSQEGTAKIKSKQFSEFGSQTIFLEWIIMQNTNLGGGQAPRKTDFAARFSKH